MNTAELIKTIRLQLGFSQKAFAEKIHVVFSTVNRWENNKSTLNSMARALIAAYCQKHGVSEALIAAIRDRG